MKQKQAYSTPCSEEIVMYALHAMMDGSTANLSGSITDPGTVPDDDNPV